MIRELFLISFTMMTLLFSGCETLLDHGSVHKDYLAIYKFTPQQRSVAAMRVQRYSDAVKRGKRPPPTTRYIAVQTLDPDSTQRQTYAEQRESQKKIEESHGQALPPEWVESNHIHCLMVFDTQSREFVGSGCYLVADVPGIGQLAQFEAVTAEFVGAPGVL